MRIAVAAMAAALLMSCSEGNDTAESATPASSNPPTSELRAQDCGPGLVLKSGACEPLPTTSTTTTTQPRTTTTVLLRGTYLSSAAKQAVIDCSAAQAYHASLIVNGTQATDFMRDMRDRICDEASDQLDREAPFGSNPVRELAVKLSGNSADLAFWELSVSFGTEIRPGVITGLMPNQAIGWEEEMRGIVAAMPTG